MPDDIREIARVAAKAAADQIGHGMAEKYIDLFEVGLRAVIEAGMIAVNSENERLRKAVEEMRSA